MRGEGASVIHMNSHCNLHSLMDDNILKIQIFAQVPSRLQQAKATA